MNRFYIFFVSAILFHGLSGAARSTHEASSGRPSSSSSAVMSALSDSDTVQAEKLNIPYLNLLLNPRAILDDDRYFIAEDYERTDLLRQIVREKEEYDPLKLMHLNALLIDVVDSNLSVKDIVERLKEHPVAESSTLSSTIDKVRTFVNAPTIEEAVRELTKRALMQRLESAEDERPEIMKVFFSPLDPLIDQTKINETILWLIRTENKSIKVASYFFTDRSILKELAKAFLRGVHIEIIVGEEGLRGNLDLMGLLYWTWKGTGKSFAKMHHKFMLFESNFAGQSIVVNGSFNLTPTANKSHENIIVLNNKDLFDRFTHQFNIVKECARPAETVYVHSVPSDSLSFDFFGSQSEQVEESFSADSSENSDTRLNNGLSAAKKLLQALETIKELREIQSLEDDQLWESKPPKRSRSY